MVWESFHNFVEGQFCRITWLPLHKEATIYFQQFWCALVQKVLFFLLSSNLAFLIMTVWVDAGLGRSWGWRCYWQLNACQMSMTFCLNLFTVNAPLALWLSHRFHLSPSRSADIWFYKYVNASNSIAWFYRVIHWVANYDWFSPNNVLMTKWWFWSQTFWNSLLSVLVAFTQACLVWYIR